MRIEFTAETPDIIRAFAQKIRNDMDEMMEETYRTEHGIGKASEYIDIGKLPQIMNEMQEVLSKMNETAGSMIIEIEDFAEAVEDIVSDDFLIGK